MSIVRLNKSWLFRFLWLYRSRRNLYFSRGGSDITGSIVAAGVQADLYENFTDVDGIYVAHPGIIEQPQTIQELTYREMRELAYAGFAVLHDEALMPAYRANIPVVIKNTNNPHHPRHPNYHLSQSEACSCCRNC